MNDQQLIDFVITSRNVQWQYQLDRNTQDSLLQLQGIITHAKVEIMDDIDKQASTLSAWQETRAIELLDSVDRLTAGIKSTSIKSIADIASIACARSLIEHSDITSLWGRIKGFNHVYLSPEQLRSYVVNTPIGGNV
ncbi:MAG: hypothetical protein HQK77_15035, partial [Desulfobacterales bacterium]|nr:hypothetical protein [Desulfobacterales bacterium]